MTPPSPQSNILGEKTGRRLGDRKPSKTEVMERASLRWMAIRQIRPGPGDDSRVGNCAPPFSCPGLEYPAMVEGRDLLGNRGEGKLWTYCLVWMPSGSRHLQRCLILCVVTVVSDISSLLCLFATAPGYGSFVCGFSNANSPHENASCIQKDAVTSKNNPSKFSMGPFKTPSRETQQQN